MMLTARKPFYGGVFGFDGQVKVIASAKVKREYTKMLKKAIEESDIRDSRMWR